MGTPSGGSEQPLSFDALAAVRISVKITFFLFLAPCLILAADPLYLCVPLQME
jgi:hypothetical protein